MGMFALATMLLATSCSEDEIVAQSSGNEVTVSFTAQLRSDVKTKAVGDDTDNVDQMIFAVYDESDKELVDLRQTITSFEEADNGKKTTTVNVVLVKGQTYSFAFWAQDKDYDAYDFNPATAEVTVNYGQTANNKSADAFFANVTNYTVNGSFEMDVTLKRPFAQVNFLVTEAELKAAKAAGFEPAQSSVTVQNAATSLNVLTGEVEGNTEATFNLANLISNEETTIKNAGEVVKLDGETETKFSYLATAYFLPTEATSQTEITASMKVTAEGKADIELSVPDIKAQRNYRTNIYGSLLTSKGEINVVIDPSFDVNSDYNVEQEEKDLYYTTLEAALKDNVNNTEALTYNVKNTDETDLSNVTITIPDATKATSLTFNLEDLAENATITIQNEDQDTDSYTGSVVVVVPEGVDLGKLTINMPDAHVTLQNGSYSEVDAITSNTTLEIGEGTAIETLTVNQGNVRIATSGSVNTITNNTNGTLYVLMAGGEWTGLSSNTDTKTIVIYEDTEHEVALNGKYSTESFANLLSYNADVLKLTELSFDVAAGTYSEVVNVTGGKTITIQPYKEGEEVVIAGIAHESNGNPSTVVVNNITIDNTLQSEGWFTGTSPNIKPCVGAWGGYLTFNNCIFTVSGASGAETGVMTWWTTDLMTLDFTKCTFNGYNDHESARAMQIYGNVNLNVTECTVNTKKDYSLKYVGSTNCTATFTKNTVTNTEYFVELGSTMYPGSNYTVIFNNSILGEGISNYVVANEENQTIIVDGKQPIADGVSLNTTTGEYEISSAAGLVYVNSNLFKNGGSYKLISNIDMKDVTDWASNVPQTAHFTFDGGGNTISNWSTAEGALLVPKSNYKINISNLKLVDCSVNTTSDYAALVIGYADANTEVNISKIEVTGATITGNDFTGALLGWNSKNATISGCSVKNSTITGGGSTGAYTGHIVADKSGVVSISDVVVEGCSITTNDSNKTKAGVVVGTVNSGTATITTSSISGNKVNGEDNNATIYGRFVPNDTGKLTIDGTEMK